MYNDLSDYQAKLFCTACNKTLGANPLASAHEVTQARHELLPINKEDLEVIHLDLYKNKVGKNAAKKKTTCVLHVNNIKTYIEKIAKSEKENLKNLADGDKLHVCWDGDGGGGCFIAEFTFINNKDR